MPRNRLMVASGLGTYLTGGIPRAATTSFLYHEASVLLWADDLLCDANALNGERGWAEQGVLISEVFSRLHSAGLVRAENLERHFTPPVREMLVAVSEADFASAPLSETFFPTVTIDPARVSRTYNGFLDINSHLFLCAKLECAFLEEATTAPFYRWKLEQPDQYAQTRARAILTRILSLRVPTYALFPRNPDFGRVKRKTSSLFKAFQACCAGQMPKSHYLKVYDSALRVFEAYEKPIRSVVLDNLARIIEVRSDKRLKRLREQMRTLAANISVDPSDPRFFLEVDLEARRALLETERALAEDLKGYDHFEKVESFASAPFTWAGLVGGGAIALVTQDPAFIALIAAPGAVGWGSRMVKAARSRKMTWHSYLVDIESRLSRSAQLRTIDASLAELRRDRG